MLSKTVNQISREELVNMYPIARPVYTIREVFRLLAFWRYKKGLVSEFEQAVAHSFDHTYTVAYSSGRVAIESLFRALHIENTTVALPAYTCIVVPYAIERSGNIPVFVEPDTQEGSVMPSSRQLRDAASIMMPTHMFGQIQDNPQKEVTENGVRIIEDACLAIGSTYEGVKAGNMGNIAVFSFNQSKQLGMIGGGVLLTDESDIDEALRRSYPFPIQSFVQEIKDVVRVFLYFVIYKKPCYTVYKKIFKNKQHGADFSIEQRALDTTYERPFSRVQSLLGLQVLKRKEDILKKRQMIAYWYKEELHTRVPHMRVAEPSEETHISHMWVILDVERDLIRKKLYERGINTGIANEYSCPTTPYYKDKKETHASASYEGTTFVGEHIINLPFYIGMKQKDVRHICKVFQEVYEAVR